MGTNWTRKSGKKDWKFSGACWRKGHHYEFIGSIVYRQRIWAVVFCPDCPRLFKLPLGGA